MGPTTRGKRYRPCAFGSDVYTDMHNLPRCKHVKFFHLCTGGLDCVARRQRARSRPSFIVLYLRPQSTPEWGTTRKTKQLHFCMMSGGRGEPPPRPRVGGGRGSNHLGTPKIFDCWRYMLGLLLCNVYETAGFDMFEPCTMSRGVWAVE